MPHPTAHPTTPAGWLRARRLLPLLAGAWLAAGPGARATEMVDLYYFERPPYAARRAASDEVAGLTATPAAQAFRAAGINFRWVELPTVRQLVTLRDSTRPACAVGWFRNAEREQLFKFTRPIYRDRPTVAIARADFQPVGPTLADALRQPRVRVLVKDGFSYGAEVDALLAAVQPERVVTSGESIAMAHMVAGGRAHFMFAAQEEAALLVELAGEATGPLKVLPFAELPPGERRHLLCSRATPDALIERLNRAITYADTP